MNSTRRGYLYGFAAYGLWGFAPLYFRLLRPAGPVEILAHRVVWSVGFLALVLLVAGHRGYLRRLVRRPRTLLGLAGAAGLIGVNWGTFIYGVNSDRVVEASLGYFINPLVTVLLGVLVLRERLRRWQWVALGVGALAVAILTADYGRLPYVALVLAGTFGLYGLIKKKLELPAAEGLFVETTLLALPSLAYLWWLAGRGEATFGAVSAGHTALLLAAGAVTSIPLLLFAGAANRIPLSALGILQYLAPVLQFLLGVLAFHEPMPPARLAGFVLVWGALIIFSVDLLRQLRRAPAADAAAGGARPGVVRG
jgi:chloramphenicol-sensitive protein RarD